MTIIRYATRADFEQFDEPPGPTVRAVAAEVDGKVVVLGGLAYMKNYNIAFMDMLDDAPKMAVMRATKKAVEEIFSQSKKPIYAERESAWANSARYLEHIGFKRHDGDTYIWSK